MKMIKSFIREILLTEYGISAGATDPIDAKGFYDYELETPDQFSFWSGSPGDDLSSDPIFPNDPLGYIGMTFNSEDQGLDSIKTSDFDAEVEL